MHEITGRTRVFGILADPIHHVKTLQALNALMEKRGFDGVLVPCHVGAADLDAFVGPLRLMGNLGSRPISTRRRSCAPRSPWAGGAARSIRDPAGVFVFAS